MKILYEHQKNALDFLKAKSQAALLMEMGTGKTLTILKHIESLNIKKVLIITKNSIRYNWKNEINEAFENAQDKIWMVEGSTKKKKDIINNGKEGFFILNYESLRLLTDDIKAAGFECVVLDESTSIKNPTAKVTKAAFKIAPTIKYRYILTGTPVTNNPLECFAQFLFLNRNILFFENYYAFRTYYAVLADRQYNGHTFKEIISYKNIDELLARIQPHSFIIKKKECLDLPDKVYETRKIEMAEEQKKIYKTLEKELVASISEDKEIVVSNILTKLLRLQQLLGGVAVLENGEEVSINSNKLQEVFNVLSEINGSKLVVWARFRKEIKDLKAALSKANYKVDCIFGDVKPEERQAICDRFNTGDLQIVIGQQQSAGYGINLTGASFAIYYSNDWSLQNRQQSEDRIHRIGQTKKTTIIDIVTQNTLEVSILRALKNKKKFQDLFMDKKGIENILKGGEF